MSRRVAGNRKHSHRRGGSHSQVVVVPVAVEKIKQNASEDFDEFGESRLGGLYLEW